MGEIDGMLLQVHPQVVRKESRRLEREGWKAQLRGASPESVP